MKKIIFVLLIFFTSNIFAGPNYQSGKITNLTAIDMGILIMLSNGVPDNCKGTPAGWMLIKQEYKAITSVVLSTWIAGKAQGTVYTIGFQNEGYCIVSQFDPVN